MQHIFTQYRELLQERRDKELNATTSFGNIPLPEIATAAVSSLVTWLPGMAHWGIAAGKVIAVLPVVGTVAAVPAGIVVGATAATFGFRKYRNYQARRNIEERYNALLKND
jgi:hypothetical protein